MGPVTILQIFAYCLPCVGFVIFFVKAKKSLRSWEDLFAQRNGETAATWEDATHTNEVAYQTTKAEYRNVIIESLFVISGAICGVVSLFV